MPGISPGVLSVASFAFVVSLFKGWIPFSADINALTFVLTSVITLVLFVSSASESRLFLLYECTGKSKAFMPVYASRLNKLDVLSMFVLIAYKYMLQTVGLIPKLKTASDGVHVLLPELRLSASLAIDAGEEMKFDMAVAQRKNTQALSTGKQPRAGRLMLLPAVTTPLMAVLLANRYCPINALGSVNTKNSFEFLDAEACRDPKGTMDLGNTIASARIGGQDLLGRRVERGVEFDIIIEVVGSRLQSKQKRLVFRQVFTILAFLSKTTTPLAQQALKEEDRSQWKWETSATSSIDLDTNAPSRWASVCADYNPIHISAVIARIFGYKNKIAHGNHVLACCLESLLMTETTHDQILATKALQTSLISAQSLKVAVQFRRPMILPISLQVDLATPDRRHVLRGMKDNKVMFTAQIS